MNDCAAQHRRALHQIPEIGFELPKTHAYLRRVLTDAGYEVFTIAKSGLYAVLEGHDPSAVLFRADMDALAIEEQTDAPYASLHKGAMHACAHDGHMAMLLTFAQRMKQHKRPDKTMIFLFQPAEESSGGALKVIESGLFNQYNIDAVIGTHLYPELEAGVFGLKAGALMGEIAEFSVDVEGKRGHNGSPESGQDALLAAANLVNRYYEIPRSLANHRTLIGVGMIRGGDASNVVAGHVSMQGTLRSDTSEAQGRMIAKMHEANAALEKTFGVRARVRFYGAYPALMNDHTLHDVITNALTSFSTQTVDALLMADDFSFYGRVAPSYYVLLGTGIHGHTLHSERFDFDDRVLMQGVSAYEAIACELGVFAQPCHMTRENQHTVTL